MNYKSLLGSVEEILFFPFKSMQSDSFSYLWKIKGQWNIDSKPTNEI